MKPMLGNVGNAREDIGEPGLGVDVVELGGVDEAEHDRGALAPAVGSAEEPRLPAQGHTSQGALGAVVRKADAAIVKECGERLPVAEHVVHGLSDRGAARQPNALLDHPGAQAGDERCDMLLPRCTAVQRAASGNDAFVVEDRVDAAHCLESERGNDGCLLATLLEL